MSGFYDHQSPESQTKAAIVSEYFETWATIVGSRADRLVYLDLFCGPGVYNSGAKSTPLIVLEKAIANPRIRGKLVALLNDKNPDYAASVQKAIESLPGVSSLAFAPRIWTSEVGEEVAEYLENTPLYPTLCFVDPFGYKGLSARLVNGILKNWGCECVFFFNYDNVNRHIANDLVAGHMDALFTREGAAALRESLDELSPKRRESEILQALTQAMLDRGKFVLPFAFGKPSADRTSHYLVFVTKSFKGYNTMKQIMGAKSSSRDQGVPTFRWAPAHDDQHVLFEFLRPLSDLREMLLADFSGQSVGFADLYETHSIGKPYLEPNYRAVLKELEKDGAITCTSSKSNRRKGTYPPHVTIHFPERGSHG